ncbi:MAG: T9SS type A sorting domain-containing protein [Saprospiraceae bacterium]|nr:T9SS type A sorting domain-containing protein [Saprospiraceae bacterium]
MTHPKFTLRKTTVSGTVLALFLLLFHTTNLQAQCDPDETAPVIVCVSGLNVALPFAPPTQLWASDFINSMWDFCDGQNLILEIGIDGSPTFPFIEIGCSDIGVHSIEIIATDNSGNSNTCLTTVDIQDKIGPVMACNDGLDVTLESPGPTILLPEDVTEGLITDNCSAVTFTIGIFGSGVTGSELVLDCSNVGEIIVQVTGEDQSGNTNSCWGTVNVLNNPAVCDAVEISGNVFYDEDSDCTFDAAESGIGPWTVLVSNTQFGSSQEVITDAAGYYVTTSWFDPNQAGAGFEVSLPDVPTTILPCGTIYNVPVTAGTSAVSADFPVLLQQACPLLQADIATPVVRACMSSTYSLSFCSFSANLVQGAYMEVSLDPNLTVTGSSIPWSSVTGNVYTFDLGDIDPAACDQFTIDVDVSCGVLQGQTLCSEAIIYPAQICAPADPGYSGASLWVSSACVGDKVVFTLKNVGDAAMAESKDYVIVEDVIMYMSNPFDLGPGEEIEIEVPANGSTWRFESPNETLYPGQFQPVAWFEGCGGINTTGLVNLFPVDINEPYRAVFCLEVTGSYDPNDKTGFPYGLEEGHYIKPNVDLDYMIRFQNTGTDTAFTVVISDQLDPNFQPGSIRPGASSHPYEFEVLDGGQVQFIFNNILLPDSTTNEAASHGFVKFQISQRPDLPEGTTLHNEAAIYFDFNDPIITNETWHTIQLETFTGLDLLPVSPEGMKLAPNPVTDRLNVQLENDWNGQINLYILNIYGQIVGQDFDNKVGENWETNLSVSGLSAGTYYLILSDGHQMITKPFVRQ